MISPIGILNKKIINLAIVIVVSSLLIFYKFNQIPGYISFDELQIAQLAQFLAHHQYIPYSTFATGHATLYYYVILLSMNVLGVNSLALRLPAAVSGVLAAALFYLILRRFTKYDWLALMCTIVFVTLRWYFNFARFSFEATFLLFLELSSLYFLLNFLKKKRVLDLGLCALFAGLAFHSYYPGKIFFLLPAFFIFFKTPKKYTLIFAVIFVTIAMPLIIYMKIAPDIRIQQQSFLTRKVLSPWQKASYLLDNSVKTAAMFSLRGDMNGRHNYPGKPALNPIASLFFIVGLFLMIRNLRLFPNQLFLSYFFISLLPTILTYPHENPNMLRSFTVLPSVAYAIYLSIEYFLYKQKKISQKLALGVILVLLSASILYELRTYFLFQSRVFRNAFEIKCPLEKVISYRFDQVPLTCRVRINEYNND